MKFEKISFEQFEKDFKKFLETQDYGFKITEDMIHVWYNNITIPRKIAGSAGYTFLTPYPFKVHVYRNIFVPTGLKVILDDDKVLFLYPSSLTKNYFQLNENDIISSDYKPDSEGHILICMRKRSKTVSVVNGKFELIADMGSVMIKANEKIAQGIIIPSYSMEDDNKYNPTLSEVWDKTF